jgi:hypothetical protein
MKVSTEKPLILNDRSLEIWSGSLVRKESSELADVRPNRPRSAEYQSIWHSPLLPTPYTKTQLLQSTLQVTARLNTLVHVGMCCTPVVRECNLWSACCKEPLDAAVLFRLHNNLKECIPCHQTPLSR